MGGLRSTRLANGHADWCHQVRPFHEFNRLNLPTFCEFGSRSPSESGNFLMKPTRIAKRAHVTCGWYSFVQQQRATTCGRCGRVQRESHPLPRQGKHILILGLSITPEAACSPMGRLSCGFDANRGHFGGNKRAQGTTMSTRAPPVDLIYLYHLKPGACISWIFDLKIQEGLRCSPFLQYRACCQTPSSISTTIGEATPIIGSCRLRI
jgi:hypothetical protein